MADAGGSVKQVWDDVFLNQRWKIECAGENYLFVNKATGKALGAPSDKPDVEIVTWVKNRADQRQHWVLTPVTIME